MQCYVRYYNMCSKKAVSGNINVPPDDGFSSPTGGEVPSMHVSIKCESFGLVWLNMLVSRSISRYLTR